MKRFVATLLLAVFAFWLSAPALLGQDDEAQLAPCCRKGGKHHCSANPRNSGPGYAAKNCFEGLPFGVAQASAKVISNVTVCITGTIVIDEPASHAQPESRYHVSFPRSSQKRGPPSLL